MNFQFQQMKPVIQRDFDAILCHYPTDLHEIDEVIAAAGSVWERKLAVIETAARVCDVHLFAHYPFAFELDFGVFIYDEFLPFNSYKPLSFLDF